MKTYSFVIPHHNTPDLLQRLIDTIPQRSQSSAKYIYRLARRQPLTAIGAIFCYLFHWLRFERKSTYYVDVIKDMERELVYEDIRQNLK